MPRKGESSSADRKEGILQFRIDPELHVLMQRAADGLTSGRVSGIIEKSILETAQTIFPKNAQAQKIPRSPKGPKSQVLIAEQCEAIGKRILSLSEGYFSFRYRAHPLAYSYLAELLRVHAAGKPLPPVPFSEWLDLPAAKEPASTAPKVSSSVELMTVARLELVQDKEGLSTTRQGIEYCVRRKLAAHSLLEAGPTTMTFEAFPPIPLLSFTRYLNDAVMPLIQVLAALPVGGANKHLRAAMESLREVLIKHPPPPPK